MVPRKRRSKGMQAVAAPASEARAGSRRASFESLYRSSRDDVYAYVAGLLRDRAAAEDVTALAFERAYRKHKSFDPERGSPRAWLFGIARNAALDELRKRKRVAELATEPADESTPAPDEMAETALRRQTLKAAMETLDPRERELIALKFFAGLSNTEIAEVIGVSHSNAGTKLHRTIEKLRRACNEAG